MPYYNLTDGEVSGMVGIDSFYDYNPYSYELKSYETSDAPVSVAKPVDEAPLKPATEPSKNVIYVMPAEAPKKQMDMSFERILKHKIWMIGFIVFFIIFIIVILYFNLNMKIMDLKHYMKT